MSKGRSLLVAMLFIFIFAAISAAVTHAAKVRQFDHQAQLCLHKYPSLIFNNDKVQLSLMGLQVHVAIPKNSNSKKLMQALNALAIVLQPLQLSVVFGPITFQQIFSAYDLLEELISRLSISQYEAHLLGNLGFSILYKWNEESPEMFMNAYRRRRKFMDEPGRQSVLQYFASAYPEWSPEKQEKFIVNFDDICDDIRTVELARRYYGLLGERAKGFLGMATCTCNPIRLS